MRLYKKIGKPERFGIGDKINGLFIDLLELTHEMRFSSASAKLPLIDKAISKIDKIKFFAEIGWEHRLIPAKDYSELLKEMEEIGRELGGWKKRLIKKTPNLFD